ncbi:MULTISPECIES: hypothetical protein [unclassified Mesorhizobium]|uniref:hypothetical protein n=3 Tax=Mesorhizobium TaxID=68287 RepID=UPI001FDFD7C2|nr:MULTISPECIES: hypothetical protein [unclassified Mesorhizobium]
MDTANHAAFADLSRPLLSPSPLAERERLAGAWRMASQDIADDIRFIRQYLKVIAEKDDRLSTGTLVHGRAYVEACAAWLPETIARYLRNLQADQRMRVRDDCGGRALCKIERCLAVRCLPSSRKKTTNRDETEGARRSARRNGFRPRRVQRIPFCNLRMHLDKCIVSHNCQLVDAGERPVVNSFRAKEGIVAYQGGTRLIDQQIDIGAPADDQPYEVTSFARKHGLTIPIADAVLFAKGPSPSRAACDTAALAFLCAVAQYARKQGRR